MQSVSFDVNDDKLRKNFFENILLKAINNLDEKTRPAWGKMSGQEMVEHLIWAFEISTGKYVVSCKTPDQFLERTKLFLHDSRSTPREFKNPLLGDNPPDLRYATFSEATSTLQIELKKFFDNSKIQPDALHTHPIFGPLNAEEWQRSHFKHCYHHLLQFGLIQTTED